MADKVPDGYIWIKEVDPNATYNPKTKEIETEYKTYKKGEYIVVNGKSYVTDPYVNRYKNPKQVSGLQHDPSQVKLIDFKQDYTVVIRKKSYYAITQGDDEEYLEVFQLNNFTSVRTSHNVYGKANASVTVRGGTRVVVSTKKKVKDKGWDSFQQLLQGWNTIDLEKWGEYKGVQYNNLERTREKAYDWAYAEKCAFEPMDEIYIFSKSNKRNQKGEYPFVQIFFGYISSVQKTYQAGQGGPQIVISADDQLKLLNYSRISNSPPQAMSVAGTSFRYDGAGNFIVETDPMLNGIDLDSRNKDGSYNPARNFSEATYTNMFAGRTPHEIIKICCIEAGVAEKYLKNRIETVMRTPFTPQLKGGNILELFVGDFKNRLWFCNEAAAKLNLEFFADEEGNIVFKIPTYNIGVNKLKSNNLGVEAPVILDEKYNRTMKVSSLYVSTDNPDMYYVTIRAESLYDIARNFLNNGALWTKLWELNPHIKDVNWVPAGTRIKVTEKEDKSYKVTKSYKETIKLPSASTLSELTDKYIPVIYPEQIVSFSFVDSDRDMYNSVKVTVEVPNLQSQAGAVPDAIQRVVADFESIKKFGFREHPEVTTPIIYDASGAAVYAGLLLIKSASGRYTGSITVIEDPNIKVGEPVRFMVYDETPFAELYKSNPGNDNSEAQAVFYVDAIDRSINAEGGVSTMTLTLKAGRMMGMPSIYDQAQELYRYYFEDLGVDLSLPQSEIDNAAKAQETTVTATTNSTSSSGSGSTTKKTSSSTIKKTAAELEKESFAGYENKTLGYIHTVLNKQAADQMDVVLREKHLINFAIYSETIQKIATIVYGDAGAASKILAANKGKPDGIGGTFNNTMDRLYPGQKIRLPNPINMGRFDVQVDPKIKEFKNKYLK